VCDPRAPSRELVDNLSRRPVATGTHHDVVARSMSLLRNKVNDVGVNSA
jgi:hypothetical protein